MQSAPITAGWIDPDVANCGTSPATCAYEAQIGIKYLRFGTADITDINLDGVTDAADEAIVQANIGLFGPNTADFNSDGDVDGDDFLIWQNGFGAGSTRAEGDALRRAHATTGANAQEDAVRPAQSLRRLSPSIGARSRRWGRYPWDPARWDRAAAANAARADRNARAVHL